MPEETKKQQSSRQKIRKALIILSFILYPITFAYLSCPIIIEGASLGIVTGGLIVFGLIFAGSLIAGRLWCGYLCPSGGLQEICRFAHDRPLWTRKLNWLKYIVFLGIFGGLAIAIWSAGGLRAIDVGYNTGNGISIAAAGGVAAFLGPVMIVIVFALIFGRRGFCHVFCPIAVLMIAGRKLRNLFRWPALQLDADAGRCVDCKKCSKECPMGLDVNGMVRAGRMENAECILCASCADACPKDAIAYGWKK